MARKSGTARLVIALSVAAVLAVFLVYVSIAGGRTPQLQPSELPGHTGRVSLEGKVVGPVRGRGYSDSGLRFAVRDIKGSAASAIPVVYHGTVPDLFKVDRVIVVDGRYRNGVFVAQKDTLVTKCPSKYTPAKNG
jgi:cytochrome c-type biogenesis protein CcmE